MSSKTAADTVPAVQSDAESSSHAVHRMRITSGGSIQAYVSFALKHLQDKPQRPLVLHTAPPLASLDSSDSQKRPSSHAPTTESNSSTSATQRKGTLHPCTLTAPRLISVVELIKRDYMVSLETSGKGKGKHKAVGLWQYTETALLPDVLRPMHADDHVQDEETRVESLKRVLEGRSKPKMTHRPYLQITLSTRPLGLETQKNVTCQYVVGRRDRKGKRQAMEQSGAAPVSPKRTEEIDTTSAAAGDGIETGGAHLAKGSAVEFNAPGKKRKPVLDGPEARAKRKRTGDNGAGNDD